MEKKKALYGFRTALECADRAARFGRTRAALAQVDVRSADVRINGDRPWDVQVHDPASYDRVLRQGSLGLGESYMDAAWESERLDETFHKLLNVHLNPNIGGFGKLRLSSNGTPPALPGRQ